MVVNTFSGPSSEELNGILTVRNSINSFSLRFPRVVLMYKKKEPPPRSASEVA